MSMSFYTLYMVYICFQDKRWQSKYKRLFPKHPNSTNYTPNLGVLSLYSMSKSQVESGCQPRRRTVVAACSAETYRFLLRNTGRTTGYVTGVQRRQWVELLDCIHSLTIFNFYTSTQRKVRVAIAYSFWSCTRLRPGRVITFISLLVQLPTTCKRQTRHRVLMRQSQLLYHDRCNNCFTYHRVNADLCRLSIVVVPISDRPEIGIGMIPVTPKARDRDFHGNGTYASAG